MVFQDILERDLEYFEKKHYLIYLPVKYFLRRFRGFFIWYLIGGICAYNFAVSITLFCWIYATLTLAVFVKIWALFRLSRVKLMIFMSLLCTVGLLAGIGLRTLAAAIIVAL